MSLLRRLPALALGAALVTGLAALSRVPYRSAQPGESMLRLSWRARGERVEHCRRATAAELAGVPAHMRRETVCEDARVPPYRLRVSLNGRLLEDGVVAGSDVTGDRPMYVLREFAVIPGSYRIEVRFEKQDREGAEPAEGAVARRADAREGRSRAIPPRLALDTTVVVAEHAVVLVTYSEEREKLVLVGR